MEILSIFQRIGSFSFLFSLCTWFFAEVDTKTKIIITIVCLMASAIWYLLFEFIIRYKKLKSDYMFLMEENKELSHELQEIEKRHKGLAAEYDKKTTMIKNYQDAWFNVGILFNVAKLKSPEEQIGCIFDTYLQYNNYLDKGATGYDHQRDQSGKNN